MTEPQPKNQIATRKDISSVLAQKQVRARFDEILGKRSSAFISSIISAVNTTPALRECDPMSVVSSAATAAAMDLPIAPGLGLAHIVPYQGVAQFQVGWKGFVQLALRSGQYKTINATKVLEGQVKKHNPFTGEMEFDATVVSDKVAGYLLYFRLLNGFEKYVYMTRAECEAHGKKYSKSFKRGKGVWVEDFDSMALKTVVKLGLSKYGPLSIDMQKALEVDQAEIAEDGQPKYVDSTAEDITPKEPTGAAAINEEIRKAKEAEAAVKPGAGQGGHF